MALTPMLSTTLVQTGPAHRTVPCRPGPCACAPRAATAADTPLRLALAPRPGLEGGAAPPSADGAPLDSNSDVEAIARRAMRQMGREYGSKQAELVEKLRDEMYDTASAFVELREDLLPGLAQQWGVPHRLLATMRRIAVEAISQAAPPSPPESRPLPPAPPPHWDPQATESSETTSRASAVVLSAESLPPLGYQPGQGNKGQQPQQQQQPQQPQQPLSQVPAHVGPSALVGEAGWFRFGHGSGREVRLTDRKRGEFYSLKEAETPAALAAELREFESFSLYGSFAGSQRGEPLRRVTLAGYVQCVRQALGWLHRVEGVPLEQLGLGLLVPGTQRGAARKVHAFLMWQEVDRGMCKRSVARSLAALIQVAKFLYHEESQVREGDKPYSDLEVIKALRAMYMGYERAERVAGHVVDSSVKWLDWPAYLEYVWELRRECAALKHNGRPRSPVDVAMSLQAYLIAAILSCVPDRQRTLRELVVGRTLVKDKNGIWSIRHTHADYKTGGTYGERPPLVIDPGMYYELEEFIGTWRAHLKPRHNFLFSKRDGSSPLTAQELARSFSLNAFRITGRKLNPHMVRDMVVTYARSGHASEHELEALAIYMGHSLAEQRGTYDRRTKAQKVQPAMGLLAKISGAAAIAAAGTPGAPPAPAGPMAAERTTAQAAAPAKATATGSNRDTMTVGGYGPAGLAVTAGSTPAAAPQPAAKASQGQAAKGRRAVKAGGSAGPGGGSRPGAAAAAVGVPAGEGAAANEIEAGGSSAAVSVAGASAEQEGDAGRRARPAARRKRAAGAAAAGDSGEPGASTARAGGQLTQVAGEAELKQSCDARRNCREPVAGEAGDGPPPELASKPRRRRRGVRTAAEGDEAT